MRIINGGANIPNEQNNEGIRDFINDANKVGDNDILDFLQNIPEDQKNYVVEYIATCSKTRHYKLLDDVLIYKNLTGFSQEQIIKMLKKGKEDFDFSWIEEELEKYIGCEQIPIDFIVKTIEVLKGVIQFPINSRFITVKIPIKKIGEFIKDKNINSIKKRSNLNERLKLYYCFFGDYDINKRGKREFVSAISGYYDYHNLMTPILSPERLDTESFPSIGIHKENFKKYLIKMMKEEISIDRYVLFIIHLFDQFQTCQNTVKSDIIEVLNRIKIHLKSIGCQETELSKAIEKLINEIGLIPNREQKAAVGNEIIQEYGKKELNEFEIENFIYKFLNYIHIVDDAGKIIWTTDDKCTIDKETLQRTLIIMMKVGIDIKYYLDFLNQLLDGLEEREEAKNDISSVVRMIEDELKNSQSEKRIVEDDFLR